MRFVVLAALLGSGCASLQAIDGGKGGYMELKRPGSTRVLYCPSNELQEKQLEKDGSVLVCQQTWPYGSD